MKVFLAQQNYHIGNFALNLEKMLQAVEEGRSLGADLVVFSELSVCGYPPRDFLEFEDFILEAEASVDALAKASVDIGILVGTPTRNPQREGKDLLNSAVLLYNGMVHGIHTKACSLIMMFSMNTDILNLPIIGMLLNSKGRK
jgi:NAD+ synthase (glutamine-hydrolysing)